MAVHDHGLGRLGSAGSLCSQRWSWSAKGPGGLRSLGLRLQFANVIFHATGKRTCELPVRVQSLLGARQPRQWARL